MQNQQQTVSLTDLQHRLLLPPFHPPSFIIINIAKHARDLAYHAYVCFFCMFWLWQPALWAPYVIYIESSDDYLVSAVQETSVQLHPGHISQWSKVKLLFCHPSSILTITNANYMLHEQINQEKACHNGLIPVPIEVHRFELCRLL